MDTRERQEVCYRVSGIFLDTFFFMSFMFLLSKPNTLLEADRNHHCHL